MTARHGASGLMVVPFLAAVLLHASPARAVSDPGEMLPDPAQEQRAEALGEQLRCLVCQNESIEQSDADLAKDLRHVLREQIAAGKSDQQVIAWMVARYGNFVRLKPPFDAETLALWGAPVLALALGGGAALLAAGRRRTGPPPPLDEAECQRVKALLEQ